MSYALSYGDAIIVTPLANLHPLFALILSYVFLGKAERITRGIVLGGRVGKSSRQTISATHRDSYSCSVCFSQVD